MLSGISIYQLFFVLPLIISPLVFPFVFYAMAKRRGLSAVGWAIVGLIPLLNWFGFIALLCIRLSRTPLAPDSNR